VKVAEAAQLIQELNSKHLCSTSKQSRATRMQIASEFCRITSHPLLGEVEYVRFCV